MNEWFTAEGIVRSVKAIREEMLRRERLTEWIAHYPALPLPRPLTVAIIMAGNLPLVGFADMLYTIAAGCKPLIKPSSKDPLPKFVATLINSLTGNELVGLLSDSDSPDVLIATGSDSSADYFYSLYPAATRLVRGSRYSVALLGGNESDEALSALGEDCFEHNAMGCRSVSRLLIPEGYDLSELADKLRPALSLCSEGYSANYRQTRALLTMRGEEFIDGKGFVFTRSESVADQRLSAIHYSTYRSEADVQDYFTERADKIQCVVADFSPFERTVPFGQAQHPTLTDYADGVDVIEFLSNCHTNAERQ